MVKSTFKTVKIMVWYTLVMGVVMVRYHNIISEIIYKKDQCNRMYVKLSETLIKEL